MNLVAEVNCFPSGLCETTQGWNRSQTKREEPTGFGGQLGLTTPLQGVERVDLGLKS